MITTTNTLDHVLIFSLNGTLTAADIDAAYDILRAKLAGGGEVSVYLELMGDFSIEGGALLKDMARAHEVLGKLKQFDRVAVVAADSWVRAIARIESAAFSLANLNMIIYPVEERRHALAWAKSETDVEHPDSIRTIETGDPSIIGFELNGKIRKQDILLAKGILADLNTNEKAIGLLARFKHFGGFELAILADGDFLKMKRDSISYISRYALVGAPGWIETTATKVDATLPFEIRAFGKDEEAQAMRWLKDAGA